MNVKLYSFIHNLFVQDRLVLPLFPFDLLVQCFQDLHSNQVDQADLTQ